ncbi:hypothetical protein GDO81_028837 [Engystomops pustulosus]|uniref:Secreted protein n=1 Tax=Engystomops pustulosus TaxID=76066 RepID=A0AAV6YEX5_ENGPU|nr:hypothetical protein GDO81_028837 [Engystomops pustulosus]
MTGSGPLCTWVCVPSSCCVLSSLTCAVSDALSPLVCVSRGLGDSLFNPLPASLSPPLSTILQVSGASCGPQVGACRYDSRAAW